MFRDSTATGSHMTSSAMRGQPPHCSHTLPALQDCMTSMRPPQRLTLSFCDQVGIADSRRGDASRRCEVPRPPACLLRPSA